MAHITEEHLHHMARKHHATMQKLESVTASWRGIMGRGVTIAETLGGAWAGGLIEGLTGGGYGPIPINLLAGAALLVVGHLNVREGQFSEHLNNVGNGLVGSYFAAVGYAFGRRKHDTGAWFGSGGNPMMHPYENGWPHAAP
jgi:hypothetical protein